MKRRPSIKNRVRAVILFASVIVLLVTTAIFALYEVLSFKTQLARDLSTMAAVVADNSAIPLAFDNKPTGAEILSALKANPDIVAAALYDVQGRIFATYPSRVLTNLLPTRLEKRGYRFQDDALILFEPVISERKPVGSLYLRASLQGLYERFSRYGTIVAAVLIGSLIMAFLLSTLLQKRISEPILALTTAAQAVAERADYSVRAPKLTEDELGTLTDAFNRMLVETQDHQSRLADQARLLDLSNDAIIVRDPKDRIVYWNRGAEEIYGWTRAEAMGKSKSELLHTEFPEPREMINAKLNRDTRWSGELIQTRRDGRRIHVSTRWALDRDARGNVGRVLITDNDITALKMFQEELERLVLERTAKLHETIGELEAFSYSISHDMRSPLRAMQGFADALLEDYADRLDSRGKDYLERIARASKRLDSLIQDVLAYSRIAKSEIVLRPVDLERLIEDILPDHPEFQPLRARITLEKPLHKVIGHEAYLTQCVTNLLGNAVKFVPAGTVPVIRIRSEALEGKVRVWFEDNGIGIEPSHFERIFQIFGQVHGGKQYGGTGIGLAIVRKAAQRMGGGAGVESELGKGSRFWITLNEAKHDNASRDTAG